MAEPAAAPAAGSTVARFAEPLVAAGDLHKAYGTVAPTLALQGVSFSVARGEFASIVGQSGSGKSTLLNLIGLLDSPTSGTLHLDGNPTHDLSKAELARLRNQLLGFVFQFHYLLPEFSVLENLLMPAAIAGRAREPELLAQADETLAILGLEGLGGKNANALSGGQKQRVAIGRALMNRPPLVLADEPTGNLDSENSAAVYRLFRRINAEWGTTFVIVTHDRAIAQQTDRILEVKDGHLVADVRNSYGPPSPEVSSPGVEAPGD